jgi:Transcriptional regulators
MNPIDRTILGLLAADARRALADIGAHVGLSPSAVNERIRRLVARGDIRRFTVEADPAVLDLGTLAFVWVAPADTADESAFRADMAAEPRVVECHHVTGEWAYLLKVRLGALADLESFLAGLKAAGHAGRTHAVVAMSSPVPDAYVPPAA